MEKIWGMLLKMGCGCAAAGRAVAEYHQPDCKYMIGSSEGVEYAAMGPLEMNAYSFGGNY